MNDWLRGNGFLVLVVVGIALLVWGAIRSDWSLLVAGLVVIVIGAVARTPRKVSIAGQSIEWPDVYDKTIREVQKSFGADAVIVAPPPLGGAKVPAPTVSAEPATGAGAAHDAVVRVEPKPDAEVAQIRTVEDFATAVADSIHVSGTATFHQEAAQISGGEDAASDDVEVER